MSRATPDERHEFWFHHIEAWLNSKQTAKIYCQTHELKPGRFDYWKRKLSDHFDTEFNDVNSHFVELNTRQPCTVFHDELTITLANGTHITGIHADNLVLLKDVLRLLQ